MPDFFETILESAANKICVIAAPGSGKTSRILIPKANRILSDNSMDAQNVLLLTFSRLSAMDLKNRVRTMERVPRASTVHSLCLGFLLSEDNHAKRVESILLDFEKETLISDLKLLFPKQRKTELDNELRAFSAGWATKPHNEVFEETEDRRAFKTAIINWLSEHEGAMMEEIVYGAVNLARQLPDAPFVDDPQYIFVDEFQDLNRLEQEFIEQLAGRSKLVLVVGDPDQSIYSFRYHPDGIRDFADRGDVEDYPYLVTGPCPKSVVTFANQLLKQTMPTRTVLLQVLPDKEAGRCVSSESRRS
jgi:DNA helicase-2/ATP-dependent DNA helicase PcrA